MNKTMIIIALSLFISPGLGAQKKERLSFDAQLARDTIGLLEPIVLSVKLESITDKSVKLIYPWDLGLTIDIRFSGQEEWYSVYDEPDIDSDQQPGIERYQDKVFFKKTLKLIPLTEKISWIPGEPDGRFPSPDRCFVEGEYDIRVRYYPSGYWNNKSRALREPFFEVARVFRVEPYSKAEDIEAYNWLLGLDYPNFLFHEWMYYRTAEEQGEKARELLSLFPNSSFSPYAHFVIAKTLIQQSVNQGSSYDIPICEEIIRHLEAAQRKTDNPWLKRSVEPELKSMRQVLGGLRSREEWERKQKEKTKNDGNE